MQRGPPSQEVQKMVMKGYVSTYGILPSTMTDWDKALGFKYFRIVQLGTNFEGSYTLGLSALEVYGLTNDA